MQQGFNEQLKAVNEIIDEAEEKVSRAERESYESRSQAENLRVSVSGKLEQINRRLNKSNDNITPLPLDEKFKILMKDVQLLSARQSSFAKKEEEFDQQIAALHSQTLEQQATTADKEKLLLREISSLKAKLEKAEEAIDAETKRTADAMLKLSTLKHEFKIQTSLVQNFSKERGELSAHKSILIKEVKNLRNAVARGEEERKVLEREVANSGVMLHDATKLKIKRQKLVMGVLEREGGVEEGGGGRKAIRKAIRKARRRRRRRICPSLTSIGV